MRIVPDNFRADPYGWLTNQGSHICTGMMAAVLVCAAWLIVFDEFPSRSIAWAAILALYVLVVEIAAQGWNKGDTVEDAIFVVGYGAGGILYTLHEVNIGTGDFTGNIWDAVPFIGLAGFHLIVGAVLRIRQRRRV